MAMNVADDLKANSTRMMTMENLMTMVENVKKNYKKLKHEWSEFKQLDSDPYQNKMEESETDDKEYILVHRNDLAHLSSEITQLKQNLPKIVNRKFILAAGNIDALHDELNSIKKCQDRLMKENQMLKVKYEKIASELQADIKEKEELRCEVQELSEQLSQQSDYSSSLGAAVCTLLWRVSRKEEGIESILSGCKVDEFFSIVTSTLDGYLVAYKNDWPTQPSDETNFLLALCGTVTNIAASAFGRNFLITNIQGRRLIDTFLLFVAEAPVRKSSVLKNLILMCVYNISINQKGLQYLCSKPDIMSLLTWHLQAESDKENRLNTLRIIQSLISEEDNRDVILQLKELLPISFLRQLTTDRDKNIQEIAQDIMIDVNNLQNES